MESVECINEKYLNSGEFTRELKYEVLDDENNDYKKLDMILIRNNYGKVGVYYEEDFKKYNY